MYNSDDDATVSIVPARVMRLVCCRRLYPSVLWVAPRLSPSTLITGLKLFGGVGDGLTVFWTCAKRNNLLPEEHGCNNCGERRVLFVVWMGLSNTRGRGRVESERELQEKYMGGEERTRGKVGVRQGCGNMPGEAVSP
jgi:hypothetical protein